MDGDAETRQAAWALYTSLHHLACSVIVGPVTTHLQDDGNRFLGDLAYARQTLTETASVLVGSHPEAVQAASDVVGQWETAAPDRLVRLLVVLDALAEISGGSLPLPPPASLGDGPSGSAV
ncbi:hypothetical protein AB0G83_07430 [Streptomyces klenkii]|uniref:hypothetical protein n=1 Tax=Streptomyces klenkii TaxID=1420899 RepID=UPI0033E9DB32